ncbi:50S ribosomal protein L6 [Arsenophonus symbiont of Ornithomya chloropus]|uniref:50S ribosomal protein L6 n=1 Tax=Arsenophonus symbiont of Ornithomya chloropus TaxID=634121 RepID=UPI0032B24662
MSRIAKMPIVVPVDVNVKLDGQLITIQGKNGELTRKIHEFVKIKYFDNQLTFLFNKSFIDARTQAGTTRSLINAMVIGVTEGFSKTLQLVGIGYRVAIKEKIISLSLGFSHLITYTLPVSVFGTCPSQTEIILKSANKQLIGQVAAELRSYRPPEKYKGKGIRYANEIIFTKESKKK